MARYSCVWRSCLWWCLLLCVLPTVEAATKKVNVPSIVDQVELGTPSLSDGILTMSTAIEGEFIPAATKNVPVRGILGGTTFGLNTIKAGTKSLIKGGIGAIVVGSVLDQLLKGVGWIQGEGGQIQKPGTDGSVVPYDPSSSSYYWSIQSSSSKFGSPLDACPKPSSYDGSSIGDFTAIIDSFVPTQAFCFGVVTYPDGGKQRVLLDTAYRGGSSCPTGSTYSSSLGACTGKPNYVPLTDQDFISMDDFISVQDSDWMKGLLKQQCVGSLAPNRCYEELRQKALDLRGPKTVDAGSTTTKTTKPNSDGTTSTTVTTTSNKYNITYSPNTMTYTSHSTTVTSTDGKPGETTETGEDPSDEADPDDTDDDVTPSPCAGTDCDGPAYTKLYEPTKDTKEKALDSYSDRVKALPIFSAIGGFFSVSASAGCPSWTTNVNFDVLGASFNYDLNFDFYCQSWFVSMAQYAKIVFSIVCAYLAFRQAILD